MNLVSLARVAAGGLLFASAVAKAVVAHDPHALLSGRFYYGIGLVELAVASGLLLGPRRWAIWAGIVFATVALAVTIMRIGAPRPCGCLGDFVLPLWLRLVYAGLIGAGSAMQLSITAKRP